MKNKSKYEIISLGWNCQVRAYLTTHGLIKTKAQGRLSMPFDLAVNYATTVSKLLKNDNNFLDGVEYIFSEDTRRMEWMQPEYKTRFIHDTDCDETGREKLIERYKQRFKNLKEAINSEDFVFFVHNAQSSTQDVNELYETVKSIRKEKPFKLIVWDIEDLLDKNKLNPDISLVKMHHPYENIHDWYKPEKQTAKTDAWVDNLVDRTANIIASEGFQVVYYSEKKVLSFSEKLKRQLKLFLTITNDSGTNAKVLVFMGKKYKIKTWNPQLDYVIIRLNGRMANQMFEWALGKAIKKQTGIQPIFDDSEETEKLAPFNLNFKKYAIKKPLKYKLFRKTIPFRKLRNKLTKIKIKIPVLAENPYFKYDEKYINVHPPVYLDGFFQSYKYFEPVRDELLKDFSLKKPLNSKNKKILEKIKNTESVSLHYRRTDYLKSRVANVMGSCTDEYYNKAVETIAQKINKPLTLFVFSDDPKWAKENIKFPHETIIVDINSGKQGYYDMELMKNCKHNIIANSSFSYWAAWLNENPDKIVIAPEIWMKNIDSDYDLIPTEWIRIGGQI